MSARRRRSTTVPMCYGVRPAASGTIPALSVAPIIAVQSPTMGACDRSGRRAYRSATTTTNRSANDRTRHSTSSGLCGAFSYSRRRFETDQ